MNVDDAQMYYQGSWVGYKDDGKIIRPWLVEDVFRHKDRKAGLVLSRQDQEENRTVSYREVEQGMPVFQAINVGNRSWINASLRPRRQWKKGVREDRISYSDNSHIRLQMNRVTSNLGYLDELWNPTFLHYKAAINYVSNNKSEVVVRVIGENFYVFKSNKFTKLVIGFRSNCVGYVDDNGGWKLFEGCDHLQESLEELSKE